jgi:hypothetical protein
MPLEITDGVQLAGKVYRVTADAAEHYIVVGGAPVDTPDAGAGEDFHAAAARNFDAAFDNALATWDRCPFGPADRTRLAIRFTQVYLDDLAGEHDPRRSQVQVHGTGVLARGEWGPDSVSELLELIEQTVFTPAWAASCLRALEGSVPNI